jgi:serine/threonine-protein kinase
MTGSAAQAPGPGLGGRLAAALAPSYELRELLGRGGFGEVYAAWDTHLKREVAIKTLRPELAFQEDVVRRFRREAEAAARLHHPCILPVFAVGEQDGLVWFTMPRVHGESLRDWLRREPQPPIGEVRRILADVAGALHVAHEAGVVHRDIKPDNILLEGDERRVLVTDFGIAKALDAGDSAITATGMAIGSPDYMSPEQAAGEPLDHRADVYSLGVVGYEMIAGQLPFGEGTVATVLLRHAREAAPSLLDLRPACPASISTVIARCLEKIPTARWGSMAELREALLTARRDSGPESSQAASPSVDRGLVARGAAYALSIAAGVTLDVTRTLPWLLSPMVAGAVALAVALEVGRLRTLGRDWRVAFGRAPSTPPRPSSPTPAATARFSAWAPVVSRVLADRVVVRGMVARLPAAERRGIQDLLPLLDRLTAEAVAAAEQLADLDQWSGHGADREDLARRRREESARLDDAVRAVARLRRAVRGADAEGIGRIRDDVGRLTGGLLRPDAATAHDQHGEAKEA